MRKVLPAIAGMALIVVALAACGPTEQEVAAEARAEEWTQVQDAQAALQGLRDEAAALRDKIAQGAEALGLDEDGFAALQEELAAKDEEVNSAADDFSGKLVQFINSGVDQDLTESEEHLAAIRMKSAEDIALAHDYVQRGGDYRRAVQIVEQQMLFDPDNADLQAALDHFSSWRYITKERFDQLKIGMSEQEVSDTIGIPFHRNKRDYPDQKAVGWFYQKDEEGPDAGGPSAIFFRQSGGVWKVSQLQWEVEN